MASNRIHLWLAEVEGSLSDGHRGHWIGRRPENQPGNYWESEQLSSLEVKTSSLAARTACLGHCCCCSPCRPCCHCVTSNSCSCHCPSVSCVSGKTTWSRERWLLKTARVFLWGRNGNYNLTRPGQQERWSAAARCQGSSPLLSMKASPCV